MYVLTIIDILYLFHSCYHSFVLLYIDLHTDYMVGFTSMNKECLISIIITINSIVLCSSSDT